jgi:TP901 family phage tail tape measure protein
MADQFGAKIKLTVDTSNKDSFQKNIDSFAKGCTLKLSKVDFTFDKAKVEASLSKQLQPLINKAAKNVTIDKIVIKDIEIDTTAAVNKFKTQLTNMLQGLKFVDLKNYLGPDVVGELYEKAAAGEAKAVEAMEKANKAIADRSFLDVLNSDVKTLDKSYADLGKTISKAGGRDKLADGARADYDSLVSGMETVKREQASLAALEGDELGTAVAAIREKIAANDAYIASIKTVIAELEKENAVQPNTAALKELNDKFKAVEKAVQKFNNEELGSTKGVKTADIGSGAVGDLDGIKSKYSELSSEIEQIKTLEGEAQRAAIENARQHVDVISGEIAALNKKKDAYQETAKAQEKAANEAEKAAAKGEKSNAAALRLMMQVKKYTQANPRATMLFGDGFSELEKSISTGMATGDFSGLAGWRTKFDELRFSMKEAGAEGITLGQRIQNAYEKFGGWTLVTRSMMAAWRTVKQMVANVKELDSALVNIQIATGFTRDRTEDLISSYSAMAQELGATTSQVANAGDTWLRQGYNIEETNELIRQSMVLSKLGQIDSDSASTALTSSLKGYELDFQRASDVVDKFTAVDMKAAVSSGYLAQSMAETATSARLSGVSMDKLVGYIASVGEISQDAAESVGVFLKTLFARMGNIKAGLLEDPETGESLSDTESVLSGVGIRLRDSESEFRNFGEVLDEVAANWENYGSVQQRAIAVAFSGTRQQEKF